MQATSVCVRFIIEKRKRQTHRTLHAYKICRRYYMCRSPLRFAGETEHRDDRPLAEVGISYIYIINIQYYHN